MASIKLTDKPVGSNPTSNTNMLVIQNEVINGESLEVIRRATYSQLRNWIVGSMTGIKCRTTNIASGDSTNIYSTDANTCGIVAFFGEDTTHFAAFMVNVNSDRDIAVYKVFGPENNLTVSSSGSSIVVSNSTGETLRACFINLTPANGHFPNALFAV